MTRWKGNRGLAIVALGLTAKLEEGPVLLDKRDTARETRPAAIDGAGVVGRGAVQRFIRSQEHAPPRRIDSGRLQVGGAVEVDPPASNLDRRQGGALDDAARARWLHARRAELGVQWALSSETRQQLEAAAVGARK
jgi:hypothetical protein